MTRSRQLTQAVSGQTHHRAGARGVSAPASMKFLGFEDNGGVFHWAIVGAGGDRLVQAATFVSYEEAKQAAGVVRSGAVSAPSENRADDAAPLELAAGRETATVTDDLDAERWLDEGGSSSSEARNRMPGATLIARADRLEPSAHPEPEPTYSCPKCGHALRVSGLGRHRVYFEVTDAPAEERVMSRVCPACGHGLAGTNQP